MWRKKKGMYVDAVDKTGSLHVSTVLYAQVYSNCDSLALLENMKSFFGNGAIQLIPLTTYLYLSVSVVLRI